MEKKIDIAAILKDCPRGMELDCTMYDNVTLDSVTFEDNHYGSNYPIKIITKNGFYTRLTKYGQNVDVEEAKCVIFPKGKKSWEGFQRPFKSGDIVFYNDTIAIFKEWGDETLFRTYVVTYLCIDSFIDVNIPFYGKNVRKEIRLATEKEKEKLFQVIKDNGYKWNEKTKTLETLLEPTFKNGDILTTANGGIFIYKGLMHYGKNLADFYCGYNMDKTFFSKISKEAHFGKVTECRFATEEEKDRLFQAIKDNGYKWDGENKILEKVIKPTFKDGDILYVDTANRRDDDRYKYIFIFKEMIKRNKGEMVGNKIISHCYFSDDYLALHEAYLLDDIYPIRFATEEEKQKLFDAIKANGYKWNERTKTLEKLIKPKFKVGDKIVNDDYVVEIIEVDIEGEVYGYKSKMGGIGGILFTEQDNWELVPDKFDVTTLKPFDKVLVRGNNHKWKIQFFEKFDEALIFPFVCMDGKYPLCIPYSGNEHLHDTTTPCSDYYQI